MFFNNNLTVIRDLAFTKEDSTAGNLQVPWLQALTESSLKCLELLAVNGLLYIESTGAKTETHLSLLVTQITCNQLIKMLLYLLKSLNNVGYSS